jgi:aryl-alcohol dehydrogenase-like predicted oxidoreductase
MNPTTHLPTIKLGDLTVNRLGFGAMRVLGPNVWGEPKDRAGALGVFRRAVALGVNFFDTAESYGPQTDEILIAEALHPYPEGFVIGTKGGLLRPSPGRWDSDARPEKLRKDLEGSLKRLRLERIDLYQLHAPDPKVPLEDSLGVIVDAQKAGKVRHIGVSNVNAKELEKARRVATIVSVQNRYSVGDRNSEDVLKVCEKLGIAFLPWYPLGAGSSFRISKVKKVAARLKATPAQVAIAWLLAKSPLMLPIPGTSSIAHLEENVRAASLSLSAEDLALLG